MSGETGTVTIAADAAGILSGKAKSLKLGTGVATLTSYGTEVEASATNLRRVATGTVIFTDAGVAASSDDELYDFDMIASARYDIASDVRSGAVDVTYIPAAPKGVAPAAAKTYRLDATVRAAKKSTGPAVAETPQTNLKLSVMKEEVEIAAFAADTDQMGSSELAEWRLDDPNMIASELGLMSYQVAIASEDVEPAAAKSAANYLAKTPLKAASVKTASLEELPLSVPEISVGIALLGIIDALLNTNDEDTVKAAFLILALNVIKLDQTME